MTGIDLSRAEWRKSSYSGQSGNCVEVARNLPGLVAVRDSNEPRRRPASRPTTSLASLPQEGIHVSSTEEPRMRSLPAQIRRG